MTADNLKILMYEADEHFVRLDAKDGTIAIGTFSSDMHVVRDVDVSLASIDFLINALTNIREATKGGA